MKLIDVFVMSLLSLATHVQSGPTPVKRPTAQIQRRAPPAGFAYSQNGNFMVDGKNYAFAGTNAYWLSQVSRASTHSDRSPRGLLSDSLVSNPR